MTQDEINAELLRLAIEALEAIEITVDRKESK